MRRGEGSEGGRRAHAGRLCRRQLARALVHEHGRSTAAAPRAEWKCNARSNNETARGRNALSARAEPAGRAPAFRSFRPVFFPRITVVYADGRVLVERTPAERAAFDIALGSMQMWYAHQKLFAILLTTLPDGCEALPYGARGWPTVERAWCMVSARCPCPACPTLPAMSAHGVSPPPHLPPGREVKQRGLLADGA